MAPCRGDAEADYLEPSIMARFLTFGSDLLDDDFVRNRLVSGLRWSLAVGLSANRKLRGFFECLKKRMQVLHSVQDDKPVVVPENNRT